MSKDKLIPEPVVVRDVIDESADVKSFLLETEDESGFHALPGQFVEVSLRGSGESTFAVSRMHQKNGLFEVSVKRSGSHTRRLHKTTSGETIGCRGPYGNHFPVEDWMGHDLLFIGGGIGLAPLRPVIDRILVERESYGKVDIVFGARSPQDILYKKDMDQWKADESIDLYCTIDRKADGWDGRVGFVPDLVKELAIPPGKKIAVICGPMVMIRYTVTALCELGWQNTAIFTTLEMKMQCGIGLCGRCNMGSILICKDGPVFRMDRIPAAR